MKAIVFAAVLALAGAASAAPVVLTPSLTSTSAPVSGVYTYGYTISFKNDRNHFQVNPGIAMPPPTGGTPEGNRLTADIVTIYDIPSFVDVSVAAAFTSKYSVLFEPFIGFNGPGTTPTDDPSLRNVTIRYIGSGVSADFTDTNAILIRSLAGQTTTGTYTSQYTIAAFPNNKVGEIGAVSVPALGTVAVPEPGSLILAALALAGLAGPAGWRRWRSRDHLRHRATDPRWRGGSADPPCRGWGW